MAFAMLRIEHGGMITVRPKQPIDSNKILFFFIVVLLSNFNRIQAAPLMKATVTETKNIGLYMPENGKERPALKNDSVKGADILRTGERSLAELEFEDQSITRLGSQSIYSFNPKTREFFVNEGLALISMPKGKGGGRIITSAVTAAIEGTTVIAEDIKSLSNGNDGQPRRGAKIIFIEGHGRIFSADGSQSIKISAGQMIIQYKDDPKLAELQEIDLNTIVNHSAIFNGFSKPLPLQAEIESAVVEQQILLKKGLIGSQGVTIHGRGNAVHEISQIDLPEVDEPKWTASESGESMEINRTLHDSEDGEGHGGDDGPSGGPGADDDPDVDPDSHDPDSDPDVKPDK